VTGQFDDLHAAVAAVPAGAWAVGVSGGADSVALLRLLACRHDLTLHVVHLNHQWRGQESDDDAAFTAQLAAELNLQATITAEVSAASPVRLPNNREARGRAMRGEIFRQVVSQHDLAGILLGHHADDQAETIFMRLARGSSVHVLRGMSADAIVGGARRLRPLLDVRHSRLVAFLQAIGQPWREDSSNASPDFTRNRVRKVLQRHPALFERAMTLGRATAELLTHIESTTAHLPEAFETRRLARSGVLVGRWQAVGWLVARGVPAVECSSIVADRLIDMCRDAATPPRQHFPGKVLVRRTRGVISAQPTV